MILQQRPGFKSRQAEVGDIVKCLQKSFFSILNFWCASKCDILETLIGSKIRKLFAPNQ